MLPPSLLRLRRAISTYSSARSTASDTAVAVSEALSGAFGPSQGADCSASFGVLLYRNHIAWDVTKILRDFSAQRNGVPLIGMSVTGPESGGELSGFVDCISVDLGPGSVVRPFTCNDANFPPMLSSEGVLPGLLAGPPPNFLCLGHPAFQHDAQALFRRLGITFPQGSRIAGMAGGLSSELGVASSFAAEPTPSTGLVGLAFQHADATSSGIAHLARRVFGQHAPTVVASGPVVQDLFLPANRRLLQNREEGWGPSSFAPSIPCTEGSATMPLFLTDAPIYPGVGGQTLHIFEARYRAMIKQVLDTGIPFGILPGASMGNNIGTAVQVSRLHHVSPEDGKCVVSLKGVRRFRVKSMWVSEESFGLNEALCEFFDDHPITSASEVERAIALGEQLKVVLGSHEGLAHLMRQHKVKDMPLDDFSFWLSQRTQASVEKKLAWLCTEGTVDRLTNLLRHTSFFIR